jgi:release factor glutamine methyltransferase
MGAILPSGALISTTIANALQAASSHLAATSSTPRLDAELLLAHVLGWTRTRILSERNATLTAHQHAQFTALVERRSTGEPVAYLVGSKAFYGLELSVDRRVLVPRPETELLVEATLQRAQQRNGQLQIADIGTGSGAIAVALAWHLPHAQIYASDLSADALAVAAQNVQRHHLHERISLFHGDLLMPLPTAVDIIVSNPPYTILSEIEPNVRQHEPWLALEGGPDGAAIYRRLLAQAPAYLRPHGAILLEIGAWQGELVAALVQSAFPAYRVQVIKDLAGYDRMVIGEE